MTKFDVCVIVWLDAVQFDDEELTQENLCLAPTAQTGIVVGENEQVIRLVHNFSLNLNVCTENDYIVIPKSLIKYRKTIAQFDINKQEIV